LAEFLDLDGPDCFGVAVADSNCRGQFGERILALDGLTIATLVRLGPGFV